MKPTSVKRRARGRAALLRNKSNVFAMTPCRGLSLSRWILRTANLSSPRRCGRSILRQPLGKGGYMPWRSFLSDSPRFYLAVLHPHSVSGRSLLAAFSFLAACSCSGCSCVFRIMKRVTTYTNCIDSNRSNQAMGANPERFRGCTFTLPITGTRSLRWLSLILF